MTESGILSSGFQLIFKNEATDADIVVNLRESERHEIGKNTEDKSGSRGFDKPAGKLVVLRLPEGIYSLKQWSAGEQKSRGKYSLSYSPDKKFRVMNGHSLYLGNLHLLNSGSKNSLIMMDHRARDMDLFYSHYPHADKGKLLVASRAFLDPASVRERVFDAYTGCGLSDYELFSKKRLPAHIEKFRTLRVGEKERKISRMDGYRLKFESLAGGPLLSARTELSDSRQYLSDKKMIKEWFEEVSQKINEFEISFEDKGFFTEFQLKTNAISEKSMIYMVTMFDDASQMIISMTFVNPSDYIRSYDTAESFMPSGVAAINSYQQCVIEKLNQNI
ncbi:MAG: hypothetical protein OEY29_05725 [Gammaproteobacteria bacterium]|nr:hypothetical protein [Gammaproteobacteria bacterium]